ncbi:MAG TPA: DUF397 domain-containing protein [Trebonia sp.]|nr:DUF397 domain-containing protein [Trebonia sp.]
MTVQDTGKPTLAELGINPAALAWERSGDAAGSIEVAFPAGPRWTRGDWVLLRVAGDPAGRILVFDRNEWDCFIDGARKGEFDDAAVGEPGVPGGQRC